MAAPVARRFRGRLDGLREEGSAVRSPAYAQASINRDRAQRLIADGLMQPAGLTAVEQAQSNGRWEAAYDGPASAAVPPDLQAALDAAPPASDLFARLDSRNRYAILPVGRVRGGRSLLRVRRRWRSGRRALTGLSGCR